MFEEILLNDNFLFLFLYIIIFLKIKERGYMMYKFRISNKECRKGMFFFGVREIILVCYFGIISLCCLLGIVLVKFY